MSRASYGYMVIPDAPFHDPDPLNADDVCGWCRTSIRPLNVPAAYGFPTKLQKADRIKRGFIDGRASTTQRTITMSKATTMSNAAVQAEGDALVALLSNGYLRIYSGAQPATGDAAIGAQVMLAELRLGTPAAPATPVTGIVTFAAITSGVAAAAGNAAWFRAFKADGVTPVLDGTADIAANTPNLVLSTAAIGAGATVSVSSFVHTINKVTAGL